MSTSGEGWFADPQDPSRLRWWDGTRWTGHTHPLPGADQPAPPLPGWWFGLSYVLRAALLACVAASSFTLWVDFETLAFVEDVRLRPDTVAVSDGERIDSLTLWTLVEVVAYLVTGVLFIIWLYTVHRSSRMHRDSMDHGSGWAIGGWLVPVLNFWRPFQVVTDVRRGAAGRRDVVITRTQGWWWGTWLASSVLTVTVNRLYLRVDAAPDGAAYVDALATAASWERLSCGIGIVCALLAIAVVREVTSLVAQPVEQPAEESRQG